MEDCLDACDECSSTFLVKICHFCRNMYCGQCTSNDIPGLCLRDAMRFKETYSIYKRFLNYIDTNQSNMLISAFALLPQIDQEDLVLFSCSFPTLLTCAVSNNDMEASCFLLSKGSDPSYTSCNGKSPLSYAIIKGNLKILEMLCKAGADVNSLHDKENGFERHAYTGRTPIAWVIIEQTSPELKQQMLSLLIQHRANVNLPNSVGTTPIFWCAIENDVNSLQILLNSGANVNWKNKKGETALERARQSKSWLVVDYIEKLF